MAEAHVLVGSTLAAYKAMPDRPIEESQAWLTHAERWRDCSVEFLAVLQVGQGHDEAFEPLVERLSSLHATTWRFSINDGLDSVTTGSRLKAISAGRNLIHEHMNECQRFTHLLLLDSDVEPPPDAVDKLLEVHWPMVAGQIPTYCMDGPRLTYQRIDDGPFWALRGSKVDGPWNTPTRRKRFPDEADVREHWASAGCWLLSREAVNRLRWGWSLDDGLTDDPWVADLGSRVGLGSMWTRHDVVCTHHPESIVPVERRDHDLSVAK